MVREFVHDTSVVDNTRIVQE